jgi:hypothetical protein
MAIITESAYFAHLFLSTKEEFLKKQQNTLFIQKVTIYSAMALNAMCFNMRNVG